MTRSTTSTSSDAGRASISPTPATSPCPRSMSPGCWRRRSRSTPPATTARTGPASPPGAPSTATSRCPRRRRPSRPTCRPRRGPHRDRGTPLRHRDVDPVGRRHRLRPPRPRRDRPGRHRRWGRGEVCRRGVREPGRSELVRATLAALRRDYTRNRDRPTRRVAPLLLDDIARILAAGRAGAGTWTLGSASAATPPCCCWGSPVRSAAASSPPCGSATSRQTRHRAARPGGVVEDRPGRARPHQGPHPRPIASHLPALCLPALARCPRRPPPPRPPRPHPPIADPADWDAHVCGTPGPRLDPQLPVFRAIRGHGRLAEPRSPVPRSTRPCAATSPTPATTPTTSPPSAPTPPAPGSSPKHCSTAPPRTPSCARPATPHPP